MPVGVRVRVLTLTLTLTLTSSDMVNVNWVTVEQGYTPIKTGNVKPSRLYKSNGNTPHTGPVSKK